MWENFTILAFLSLVFLINDISANSSLSHTSIIFQYFIVLKWPTRKFKLVTFVWLNLASLTIRAGITEISFRLTWRHVYHFELNTYLKLKLHVFLICAELSALKFSKFVCKVFPPIVPDYYQLFILLTSYQLIYRKKELRTFTVDSIESSWQHSIK